MDQSFSPMRLDSRSYPTKKFLQRLTTHSLSTSDFDFLLENGFAFEKETDLNHTAFLSRLAGKCEAPQDTSYVILVPTLRCDLACSYCQVSRVNEDTKGFDWSDETVERVLSFLVSHCNDRIQIEFQGGEPTLRIDLLNKVVEACRANFDECTFVICTNLSRLSEDLKQLIASEDVFVSTSLDGTKALHQKQRTISGAATTDFLQNFTEAVQIAAGRVSALPTLNPDDLPEPKDIIESFSEFGIYSIFLRPIYFHGFARKRFPQSIDLNASWKNFYRSFILEILRTNATAGDGIFEEYYLTLALSKLTRLSDNSHIDWRSPNWLGFDHILVDFDGTLYPSDEARMLARSRLIDLSIGDVNTGIDEAKRGQLQNHSINALDPWCSQCVYQGVCGADPIDDIARHGRVDIPKPVSAYCQKNMHVLDMAVDLLYSDDPTVQYSIQHWLNLPAHLPARKVHA